MAPGMAGAPGVGPGAGAGGGGGGGAAAGLKTYFKTPEGRYKLQYEKTHSAVLHYSHGGKTVSQVRLPTPVPSAARGSRWVGGWWRGGIKLLQWMILGFGFTANRSLVGFRTGLKQS